MTDKAQEAILFRPERLVEGRFADIHMYYGLTHESDPFRYARTPVRACSRSHNPIELNDAGH